PDERQTPSSREGTAPAATGEVQELWGYIPLANLSPTSTTGPFAADRAASAGLSWAGATLTPVRKPGQSVRERTEEIERQILGRKAVLSGESKGRDTAEDPHPLRTEFQRDRDRIVHSK